MTNGDHEHDTGWQQGNDGLDRELDAALAKYAAAEPPAGLEERVLASLRAEGERAPHRAWWLWGMAGALAAALVVAVALAWRADKPSHPVVANHPPAAAQVPKEPTTQVVSNTVESAARTTRSSSTRKAAALRPHLAVPPSVLPKLDQFPSAQPPSQQELALRRYVRQFPQEATLIARAQEEYEKEIQQQMKDAHSQTESDSSDQQER